MIALRLIVNMIDNSSIIVNQDYDLVITIAIIIQNNLQVGFILMFIYNCNYIICVCNNMSHNSITYDFH